jgi:integrase
VDRVKSEYSEDDVPLDPAVAQVLEDWRENCPATPEGWLFPNPTTGKPYHASEICKNYIRPAGEKLGIGKIGWHTFRHYAGRWTIPGKRRTDSPKPHYCGLWNFASTAARHSLGPRFLT